MLGYHDALYIYLSVYYRELNSDEFLLLTYLSMISYPTILGSYVQISLKKSPLSLEYTPPIDVYVGCRYPISELPPFNVSHPTN
jgi:hypothetical protein